VRSEAWEPHRQCYEELGIVDPIPPASILAISMPGEMVWGYAGKLISSASYSGPGRAHPSNLAAVAWCCAQGIASPQRSQVAVGIHRGPVWKRAWYVCRNLVNEFTTNYEWVRKARNTEQRAQARLLRDVFQPFSSHTVHPSWLTWNDGTARKIAQAIYDERAFERLPVLADALEDAGCDDADILRHCREPGEHVRGCWVIDLLLGKE
jgi:hypothetical protein